MRLSFLTEEYTFGGECVAFAWRQPRCGGTDGSHHRGRLGWIQSRRGGLLWIAAVRGQLDQTPGAAVPRVWTRSLYLERAQRGHGSSGWRDGSVSCCLQVQ